MKAPDKIYLNPLLMEDGESIVRQCTFERLRDSQIEYTRTDAFIEKACEYFIVKKEIRIGEDLYCSLLNEEEIEDFKTYMKGE